MTIISLGAKGLKVLPSFTCRERVKFITNILQVQKGLNVIPIFFTGRKGLNLSSLFKAGNLTIISLGAKGLKVIPKFHEGKGKERVKFIIIVQSSKLDHHFTGSERVKSVTKFYMYGKG